MIWALVRSYISVKYRYVLFSYVFYTITGVSMFNFHLRSPHRCVHFSIHNLCLGIKFSVQYWPVCLGNFSFLNSLNLKHNFSLQMWAFVISLLRHTGHLSIYKLTSSQIELFNTSVASCPFIYGCEYSLYLKNTDVYIIFLVDIYVFHTGVGSS